MVFLLFSKGIIVLFVGQTFILNINNDIFQLWGKINPSNNSSNLCYLLFICLYTFVVVNGMQQKCE